ncbi:hypothetical protein TL16_g01219 [Triparma laevis f. inornata]|uniref:Uncharacterized protein n=1 Tax=Triparma laevis f. inornata TaxID=1714386 RepID=A0A9W6ZHV2_9STRA|nr:hypothetical protein TL16_g01219 [Triparma laevis f. inornata]
MSVEYLNWWKKRETETGVVIAVEGLDDVPEAAREELEKIQDPTHPDPPDRVTFRGFYRLEREGYGCTSCVLRLQMKCAKSSVSRRLSISGANNSNEGIIRSLTSRKKEVDDARIDFFAKSISEAPELNEFEEETIKKGIDLASPTQDDDEWQRIATTSPIHMFRKQVPPLPAAWGKAVASIDIPADELLAYLWIFDSFSKMEAGRNLGDVFKKAFYLPSRRSQVCIHYQKGIANFKPRLFCTYGVWSVITPEDSNFSLNKSQQPYYVYSFCPLSEAKEAGLKGPWDNYISSINNTVSGISRGCYIIKPTSKKTCEWTFILYGHASGYVPSWAVNWKLGEVLHWLYDVKMKYENSLAAENIKLEYSRLIENASSPRSSTTDKQRKQASNYLMFDFNTFMRGEMFARCKNVEEALGLKEKKGSIELNSEWEKMTQVSPFVRVCINSRRGGVYAETTVDCLCSEALAWLHNLPQFLFNRPSTAKSACYTLPLTPTGLDSNINSPQQYAQIYPAPHFVKNREFVIKSQWVPKDSNGVYYLIFESVDEDEDFVVDYGQKMTNNHRASKIGFFRVTKVKTKSSDRQGVTVNKCKIEYLAKVDLKFNVGLGILRNVYPQFEKESLERHAENVMFSREVLTKDDDVDESLRLETQKRILESNKQGVKGVQSFEKHFEDFWFKQYKTGSARDFPSHPFVKTKVVQKAEEFYVHESFTLDASPEAIVAYLYNPELRKRVRKNWKEEMEHHVEKEDQPGLEEAKVNEKKVALIFNNSHGRIGADPTAVCCTSGLYTWAKGEDGTTRFVVMNQQLPMSPNSSDNNSLNSGTSSSLRPHMTTILSSFRNSKARDNVPTISLQLLVKLTPTGDIGDISQTKVDFKVVCNFSGVNGFGHSVGSRLIEKVVGSSGKELWEEFERSRDIDSFLLNKTLKTIHSENQTYSWEEEKMIASGIPYLGMFESNESGLTNDTTRGLKPLTTSSPLVEGKVAWVKGGKDVGAFGSASSVVRASPEEILAFIWNTTTRKYLQSSDFKVQDIVLEPNSHSRLNYVHVHFGGGFKDRDFLGWSVWKKINPEVYIHVAMPAEHDLRPRLANCVRGKYPAVTKLTKLSDNETRLDYIVNPSVGGIIPKFLSSKFIVEMLDWNYFLQSHFLKQRRLEMYDVKDGLGLGEAFFITTSAVEQKSNYNYLEARLMEQYKADEDWSRSEFQRSVLIFTEYQGMKELRDSYPWVVPMMAHVVINRLRPSENCDMRCKAMSSNQGRLVGRSFAQMLATNLTYTAAVDEWILRYPCLKEIDAEFDWFRPMMETVGCRLLGRVAWGTKMRVILGASLSVLDMLSDLYLVYEYFSTPDDLDTYAIVMTAFIGLNIIFQCIVVIVQNHANKTIALREILFVVFCFKPGVDAYRVASGDKQDAQHRFTRELEMQYTRAAEIVFESIPGTILQIYVIVNSGVINRARVFSLVTGSLVTGFMSASMCYDFDTNPVNRKANPDFYGMLKDKQRYLPFSCLTLMGSIMLLLRCFSSSMLLFIGWKYLVGFVCIDFVAMMVFKVIMSDFSYWIPIEGGVENAMISFMLRLMVKFINDFVAIAQLRHPYELGGAYWTFGLVVSVFASLLSTYFYSTVIDRDERHFEDDFLWKVVGSAAGSWVLLFIVFIQSIKEDYISTFFSSKRGADMTMDYFIENESDEIRANVFLCNKRHWEPIRKEVKDWCLSNFEDWWEADAEWLNEAMLAAIPDDFIPEAIRSEIKKQKYLNMLHAGSFSEIAHSESVRGNRKHSVGGLMLSMKGVVSKKEQGGSELTFRRGVGAKVGTSIDNFKKKVEIGGGGVLGSNSGGGGGDYGGEYDRAGSRDYVYAGAGGSKDYGGGRGGEGGSTAYGYGYDGPRSLPLTPMVSGRREINREIKRHKPFVENWGLDKAVQDRNARLNVHKNFIKGDGSRSWRGRSKRRGSGEGLGGGRRSEGGSMNGSFNNGEVDNSPTIQKQGSKGLLGSLGGSFSGSLGALIGSAKIGSVDPMFDYGAEDNAVDSSGIDSMLDSGLIDTISSSEMTPGLPARLLLTKYGLKESPGRSPGRSPGKRGGVRSLGEKKKGEENL